MVRLLGMLDDVFEILIWLWAGCVVLLGVLLASVTAAQSLLARRPRRRASELADSMRERAPAGQRAQ